jgi:hypothetical protein
VTAINRQLPFKTEVPLTAIVRGVRDDRQEQGAGLDLLADRGVPGVPAPQLALVEPNLDSGDSQGLANPFAALFEFLFQASTPTSYDAADHLAGCRDASTL